MIPVSTRSRGSFTQPSDLSFPSAGTNTSTLDRASSAELSLDDLAAINQLLKDFTAWLGTFSMRSSGDTVPSSIYPTTVDTTPSTILSRSGSQITQSTALASEMGIGEAIELAKQKGYNLDRLEGLCESYLRTRVCEPRDLVVNDYIAHCLKHLDFWLYLIEAPSPQTKSQELDEKVWKSLAREAKKMMAGKTVEIAPESVADSLPMDVPVEAPSSAARTRPQPELAHTSKANDSDSDGDVDGDDGDGDEDYENDEDDD